MTDTRLRPDRFGGSESSGRYSWWATGLIAVLLVVHAALAFDSARQWTVTHDEYWHVPVGLLSLRTGRFDFDNLNPPLVRCWAALPLLFGADPALDRAPGEMEGWGDLFLQANRGQYQFWLTLARTMNILLSVATGATLAIWTWQWFGPAAACLTAGLWCLSPNVLANAAIVTTDLGAAFFFAATLFLVSRYAERPTWSHGLATGAVLGLAQLAKFTALLLYPLAPLLWLILYRPSAAGERVPARTLVLQWAALLGLSIATLNAGYLFQGSFTALQEYRFGSRALSQRDHLPGWIQGLPVPLPRDYVAGIDAQRRVMEGEHPVFLDGNWRTDGFPLYYLKTLLYKMPHSTQALLVLTAVWLFLSRQRESVEWRRQAFLLLPAMLLLALASVSGQQLGVRYILPVFPVLFLFAGQAVRWLDWRRHRLRTIVFVVCIAAMPLALRYHPHHLTSFNELAGGPIGGREHLLDSNLDWGQDLHGLKEYLKEHPVADLRLAYFGTMSPEALGIEYRLPPLRFPEPGWYAVSVNFVQGRPHLLRDGRGGSFPAGIDEFGYFRFFEPVARIGYSIDVYHLTVSDVAEYRAALRSLMRETQL